MNNISIKHLHRLINQIWKDEKIPHDWRKGLLVKRPKKGDKSNCNNWRGITLLSIPSKLLCNIILQRMKDEVDQKMRWTSWLQTRTFLCWPDCHTENHHRTNYRMAIITRPQLYRFPEGVWQHWLPNPLEHSWALWNSTEDHFSNKALVRGILLSSHPFRNNDCSIPSNNWRKTMMPPISPSLSYWILSLTGLERQLTMNHMEYVGHLSHVWKI